MRTRGRPWVRRLVLLAVSAVITFVVVRLVGAIDWAEVWDALSHLSWWQPIVAPRRPGGSARSSTRLPLALYIPGVSAYRATINDQGAILMSTVAPPPSDLALRMAMFNSWGVPTAKGLAGTVMNTLTFDIVRFSAPAVGFLLLAITGILPGVRWFELLSIAIAVTHPGRGAVRRTQRPGWHVGSEPTAARLARRVRKNVDAEGVGAGLPGLPPRHHQPGSATASRARWSRWSGCSPLTSRSLTLCLRFVGVDSTGRAD